MFRADYDPIKQVAIARKNLATTIGLLQLFRSIPQKAEELTEKLNDDRQLKNIYKELRRMVAVRDKAFTKGMEYAGGSGLSDTVKESFDALQRVALDVEDRCELANQFVSFLFYFLFEVRIACSYRDCGDCACTQCVDEYSRLFGTGARRPCHSGAYARSY